MKRTLSFVLVLLMLAGTLAIANAESVKLAYSGGSIHLRTGPGTKYSSNGVVKNGDVITVLSQGKVWSKIQTGDSREGYIKNLYIYGIGKAYAEGTTYYSKHSTAKITTKYASSKVNLRAGAAHSQASIGHVSRGEKVTLLGKNGSWYLVATKNGTQGFVHKDYVKTSSSSSSSSTSTKGTVTAQSGLNMRAGKGTNTAKIGCIPKGAKVTILNTSNSSWWYVKYGSKQGYVSSKYVKK